MSLSRIGLAVVGAVMALVLGGVGSLAWMLATEPGTAWLVARVRARIPALATVAEISGTMWHGLELRDIVVATDRYRIQIDSVDLELDLGELLERRLGIDRIAIGAVRYEALTPSVEIEREPAALPIEIVIDSGSIESLVVVRDDEYSVGPAEFAATILGQRVTFDALDGIAFGVELSGAGAIVLGSDVDMDVAFEWAFSRNDIDYAGSGDATGRWPQLRVHQDIVAPAAIVADGEVEFGAQPSATVDLSWTALRWPWATQVQSEAGTARLTGWLDAFAFEGAGDVAVDDLVADFAARGTGTPSALEFEQLELASASGRLSGRGRVDLLPTRWDLEIESRALDPSLRLPDWPGNIDLTTRFSGQAQPFLSLTFSDLAGVGELRGNALEATGAVSYDAADSGPGRWTFADFDVLLAGNRFSIDGSIAEDLSLTVAIDAPAVGALIDDAAGGVVVDGMLTGTLAMPAWRGTVAGSMLRFRGYAANTFALDGEIVADEARTVALDLTADGVTIGERLVDRLTGRVSGTAGRHAAELDAVTAVGSASLRAEGAWLDGRWDGRLSALSVVEPTLGQWQLSEPVELVASRSTLELQGGCLIQSSTRFCATIRWGTEADALDVVLESFDATVLSEFLPDVVSIGGRYDASASLIGPLRRPSGRVAIRGLDSVISMREPDQPPLDIRLEELSVDAELDSDGRLDVSAALASDTGGRVDVESLVSELWSDEPQLAASIAGRWPDLAILSLLSPDVGEVGGVGSVDIAIDGPLRQPAVRGNAHWAEGRVAVPSLGLLVENVEADIASADGSELAITGSGAVGAGRVSMTGTTRIDPAAGWPTDLQVFGQRLEAVRLPEAQIFVSPALAVHAELPRIDISGAFLIPEARIELEELPPQAVVPSPDTVVHGVERAVVQRPLRVNADIRVGLGEEVRYAGAGLDVALSGAMGLRYASGEAAVASGAVRLSGQYQAYGQTLQIDQGQLLFAGPLENPALDVRATRQVEQTTVGIQLSGTVEAPISRIFSEPAMSEADALAYLLLGRPLSTTGDEETATLESAAFAMGLQQALPAIQRVGETLGLDEFSVQTTSTDTGELMAGKRLSSRVYIRYTYGLFNRIGGLLMRFNLNERFSLETRSGDYRSMDLIYTVERD